MVSVDVGVDPGLVHSAMMQVRFKQVCKRGLWHVLRLYHRSRMNLLGSEMWAEHVGSVLRFVEKRHSVGRMPSTETLRDAVMLRTVKLTGGVQCCSFLRAALQEHFQTKPLHFFLSSRTRKRKFAKDSEMLAASTTLRRLRHVTSTALKSRFADVVCWPGDIVSVGFIAGDHTCTHFIFFLMRLPHPSSKFSSQSTYIASCMPFNMTLVLHGPWVL